MVLAALAEAVVVQVVDDRVGGVDDVAHRAEMVGQVPGGAFAATETGNQFVDGLAVQVAGGDAAGGVEVGPDVGRGRRNGSFPAA